MKPKALKIVEIIFMSILGFIILVLSIFIIQRLVNKDKPANILGFYLYEVDISGSMYNPGHPDSLSPGDLLFVRKEKEYVVEGPRIEKMLGYTNLESEKGFKFFQHFLKDNGILDELEALGIQEGDTVRMYGLAFNYYK